MRHERGLVWSVVGTDFIPWWLGYYRQPCNRPGLLFMPIPLNLVARLGLGILWILHGYYFHRSPFESALRKAYLRGHRDGASIYAKGELDAIRPLTGGSE